MLSACMYVHMYVLSASLCYKSHCYKTAIVIFAQIQTNNRKCIEASYQIYTRHRPVVIVK